MNKPTIKFDTDLIKTISLIQSIIRVDIKDLVEQGDKYYIIVPPGKAQKAVGRNAENVKRLENKLNKKVKIIEYSPNIFKFIKNLYYPLKIAEATQEDKIVYLKPKDIKTRAYLIGRNASMLRFVEGIVKRYFDIDEIKVLKEVNNNG